METTAFIHHFGKACSRPGLGTKSHDCGFVRLSPRRVSAARHGARARFAPPTTPSTPVAMGGLAPFAALPRPRCASPASDTPPPSPHPPFPGRRTPGRASSRPGTRGDRGPVEGATRRDRRARAEPTPPLPPRPRSVRASAPRDAPRDAFRAPRDTPPRARTPEAPRLTLPPPASSSSSARPTFLSLPPRATPGKGTTTTPRGSLPSATSTDATSGRATTATSPARNRTELATTLTRGPHRCASCPPPPPSPP